VQKYLLFNRNRLGKGIMNLFLELTGWLGNICFFLGAILTAKAKRSLFIWQIGGNLFYNIQAISSHNYSLFILGIVLICVNIVGWINWRNK